MKKETIEKAILIGCHTADQDEQTFESSIEELESLAFTVDANVLEIFVQNRDKVHSALYIGTGKVEEVKAYIDEHDVGVAIINNELSPSQSRNLEEKLEIKILDRTQLILDIFAMRARTKEGKLQVELAQLQYLLPRLHGQGTALSRLGGGIGTRGPGETKLETDQRHIRRRITEIKRSLDQVVKQRNQYRERRKKNAAFQISIVGYTNAGKSTIFNYLSDTQSLAEDKLFATLDPMTRKITLPSGFQPLISDTVGFIQELPTTLIAAFRSTLEEVVEADFILHVVDASNEQSVEQEKTVYKILDELGAGDIPMLTVYNKSDLLANDFIPYSTPHILMSALKNEDYTKLQLAIEKALKSEWEPYDIKLNSSEGKLINQLKRETILEEEEFVEEDETYLVKGFVSQHSPLYLSITKR
ncbi:GTP-binding protein HflX [Alkalibacillus filiformis]|uniref:GTPase HflX n=1 Tax=Alkalibacillus filiformis TaxID=200990 RepID=A0ABU0DQH7_9BACI|nr:GTPase HflX [Alkalibacillus filiformis]MDQ0350702.1 GTP-binding protein HflX [Alkalibacillus filiformis]